MNQKNIIFLLNFMTKDLAPKQNKKIHFQKTDTSQTFNMEFFVKKVNDWNPLTIPAKPPTIFAVSR